MQIATTSPPTSGTADDPPPDTTIAFDDEIDPIDDETDDQTDDEDPIDDDFDPDRLVGCAYWRCDELFEPRSANQIYCRKACRSRQNKWQRAQDRAARRNQRRR